MPKNPKSGNPDIFVHGRGNGTDHPAVSVTFSRTLPYPARLIGIPQLVPALFPQIPHDRLFLHAVAGDHITEGIYEKGISRHIAGQKPLVAIDIINQAMVKIGAEPFLGRLTLQKLVN